MALNQHIYADLDLTFMASPVTGDVALKFDEQAVIASIRNLLLTNLNERPFQPDVGSTLNALLFEPNTPITATLIENEVVRVLGNYEPRATVDSVVVTSLPDSNQFTLYLSVYIGNQTTPTAINLLLQRTR